MDWFKLLKAHCKYIDRVNQDFFWNNNSAKDNKPPNKFHTLAWDKIYRPKNEDGLSRCTEDMNTAFLAK